MTQTHPTPAERVRAAAAASWGVPCAQKAHPSPDYLETRPEMQVPLSALSKERRDALLARYTSEGVTPAYLKSREAALLRELQPIENELAAVRQQLAQLPTAA